VKNPQLSYYQKNKVNPVFIETRGKKWEKHISVRVNLYENHLKLPISWFEGKRILEFGPNGGENSLILAMYGAQISLVEPHKMIHKRIRTLYNEASLEDYLLNIDIRTLEQYKDDELYDLVIAEGFIHALPDRLEVIRKLCSFSSNFVIFTYNEKPGWFFESLKRAVFKKIMDLCELSNSNWEKTLDLACKIFLDSYEKLGSARSFDSWVRDILLNPAGTSKIFNSLNQLFPIFKKLNFEYYSGSPVWDLRYGHKWYKDVSVINLLDEYRKNIPFFITGNKNEEIGEGCISKINSMTEKFLDYSSGLIDFREIECLSRLDPLKWEYADEINQLLILLSEGTPQMIIDYYKQSSICNMWGMPHHYVCLKKKFN